MPTPDPDQRGRRAGLAGSVPDPANPPIGCRFHTRCPAVIQPAEYDFDQSVWRSSFDLRTAIRDRTLDVEGVRERLVAEGTASTENVSETQLRAAVRAAYDIPDELTHADAERVLAESLSAIADGEFAAAGDRLAAAFSTVCERNHPDQWETAAGHPAASHLHDNSGDVTEPESPPVADD